MGKADDANAVLDPRGRVYGVQGLRVVDASSMPVTPPGHIMASVCTWLPSPIEARTRVADMRDRYAGGEDRRRHQERTLSRQAYPAKRGLMHIVKLQLIQRLQIICFHPMMYWVEHVGGSCSQKFVQLFT